MNLAIGQELTLRELLAAKTAERICASLTLLLDSPVAIQDVLGDTLGGAQGLQERARVDLVLELEPIGYLLAPQAEAAAKGAAAVLVRQLLLAQARYRMASDTHLASTQADYEELQGKHAALKESEAKYRALSAELESRVAAQVALIDQRQSQLYQAERLASVGQLAAGVAHEMNSPLGFVNSNLGALSKYCGRLLELLAAYQAAEPQIADAGTLEKINALKQTLEIDFVREDLPALFRESEDGLHRVTKIVQDLKDFSHVNESEWAVADLNDGLDSTLNVVWSAVKHKATVEKRYGTIPRVECMAAQLNQVFMNLIVNAVQALDDGRETGKIILSTGHESGWVWVGVEDNGCGMSEAVQQHVYEPFFTTQPIGRGTGLGLSVAYNIVQEHHGRIELRSKPGEGTLFRIWIPVSQVSNAEA